MQRAREERPRRAEVSGRERPQVQVPALSTFPRPGCTHVSGTSDPLLDLHNKLSRFASDGLSWFT